MKGKTILKLRHEKGIMMRERGRGGREGGSEGEKEEDREGQWKTEGGMHRKREREREGGERVRERRRLSESKE